MKNRTKRAGAMQFTLSEYDIKKLIDSTENLRNRVVLELLIYTGCRRKELVLLRVQDVDFENEKIFLPTLKRQDNPYNQLRQVPIISQRMKQDIQVYLQLWREKYNLKDNNRLIQHCSSSKKDGISSVRVNQIVDEIAKKAGVSSPNPYRKHLNPHIFRHSFVRHARRFGLDFKIIQQILGHASIATTFDMYGQPSWDEIRDEAQGKMANYAAESTDGGGQ